MALSDGHSSTQQVEQAQARARQREEARLRNAAIQKARESEPKEWADAQGALWRYVTLDGESVRIDGYTPASDNVQLEIPSDLESLPVVALGAECFQGLSELSSVVIPDSVVAIGNCAFRDCGALESIIFPKAMAEYDPQWVRGCHHLKSITLPGQMEKITSRIFEMPSLEHLVIGAGTAGVMPGAFLNSKLKSIEIDTENPVLSTDGRGIYGASALLALATPCEEYEVRGGCVALAKKAMSSFAALRSVHLPETLVAIGDFAFTKTGIERFVAPSSLEAIGERAFFACTQLREVILNEGLIAIGDNAFSDTAIDELLIPGSVKELGNPLATKTSLVYSGADATFKVQTDSPNLLLDESGALYVRTDEGLVLLRMMEPNATELVIEEGTVAIADGALLKHPKIERIVFPTTLKRIGKQAFKDCRELVEVRLPEGIEHLDEEAFLGTSIEAINIPASLTRIGSLAIVTHGAHHGDVEPSLKNIDVAADNPRFRMDGSLLIESMDNGHDRVIVCTGSDPDVVVPSTVNAIAPYAFNGLRRLRSLSLSDAITMVEVRGLGFDCLLERLHIDLVEPVEGHNSFDIDFPDTARAAQQMMLAFNTSPFINVSEIMDHYDNSIVNASGFDGSTGKVLEPYEQVKRILARMEDPVYMTPVNKNLADRVLQSHLADFCLEIARHDDKDLIDDLIDLGYLNVDNISEIIEVVGKVQDASITNHLLDAKRRMTGTSPIDFDSEFEL